MLHISTKRKQLIKAKHRRRRRIKGLSPKLKGTARAQPGLQNLIIDFMKWRIKIGMGECRKANIIQIYNYKLGSVATYTCKLNSRSIFLLYLRAYTSQNINQIGNTSKIMQEKGFSNVLGVFFTWIE